MKYLLLVILLLPACAAKKVSWSAFCYGTQDSVTGEWTTDPCYELGFREDGKVIHRIKVK